MEFYCGTQTVFYCGGGGGGIQCMEEPFLLALTSIEKVVVKEFMV